MTLPDSIVFDIAFAVLTILSLSITGIAGMRLLASRYQLDPLELLAYGVGLGVVLHALIGLIVVIVSVQQQFIAIALLLSSNVAAMFYWWKTNLIAEFGVAKKPVVATLTGWLVLAATCLVISHITIKFPDNLFDGPYVIKNHNLHVKIQTITGHLPADNYLPYLVGDFFLRDISFKDERPLMPGQEIANRPILMALTAIPFRAALDPPPKFSGPLPKFQYAGSSWPDVGVLGEDRYFRLFLVIGIVLNAMIIVGIALLFKSFGLTGRFAVAGLLLILFSPYFISQVLFTWPKAMAAFFLLLAIHALDVRRLPALAGLLVALAYNSHPYAVVFAGSFALYLMIQVRRKTLPNKYAMNFVGAFLLGVAPWFIWTKLVLKIPSDLVTQNLFQGGSFADLIWVRIYNLFETLIPRFLEVFPFDADKILQASLVCVPGIVGLLFFMQGYAGCRRYFSEHRFLIVYGMLIPAVLLSAVFSAPAVPALHGYQAITPILVLLAMKWMRDHAWTKSLVPLLVGQLLINAGMLAARADTLGLFDKESVVAASDGSLVRETSNDSKQGISLLTWSSAEIKNAKLSPNINVPVAINGVEKKSIWINPPTSMTFKNIQLNEAPSFHAFAAIHPNVWTESSADGAVFRVAVISDNTEHVLLEEDINPFSDKTKKQWNDLYVDLADFANRRVDLVLSVSAGKAGNDYADWCIWGEPIITPGVAH